MLEAFQNLSFLSQSVIAGLIASLACGLGVIPLAISQSKNFARFNLHSRIGFGYAFSGGLMFAASVYNLILPALTIEGQQSIQLVSVSKIIIGMMVGCGFIYSIDKLLGSHAESDQVNSYFGSKTGALIFVSMLIHSIPEGVAVGVGFVSPEYFSNLPNLGIYIAVAIGIHNIPEGLAVALPLHSQGISLKRCFWIAVLTSLPQPIMAVPASLMVWAFKPLLIPSFGFAAGAMMYLVICELIPQGLEEDSPTAIAWAFMLGFSLMLLVQVLL